MRFFYLDAGLRDDVGHHANYCRYIVGELRARGVETLPFAHRVVSLELQSELGAIPYFRVFTYAKLHRDPIVGWLHDFGTLGNRHCEDLRSLPPTAPDDIVYASSVSPTQLMALLYWRSELPPERRPTFVVESSQFGLTPGRGLEGRADVPSPNLDATATLFRFAADRLPRETAARFHVVTFDAAAAELFGKLLDYPVHGLPLPYPAVIPLRNRAGARSPLVAILGYQQAAKGYDRLPAIIERLLQERPEIRLLLQVSIVNDPPETLMALRAVAGRTERLRLEEAPAGRSRWPQLLDMADLVLCPHRPEFYFGSFSSTAAEALANGIPLVVPAGTSLETLLTECGAGTTFDRFETAPIAVATMRALDHLDLFAARALQAAVDWPKSRGPARMVDRLMHLLAAA